MSQKIYALDSTAFYAGIPFQGEGRYYTTYQILDEVRHQRIVSQLIHSRVQVVEPSKDSIQKTKAMASKTGDARTLSEADVSIIAASLDLSSSKKEDSIVLVTDDFAVRNVAEVMGISLSESTIRGEWKNIKWKVYCKGCGKEYPDTSVTTCDVCGTKLTRKPSAR